MDENEPLKTMRKRRKMQRVTMTDVANRAEVSPSTVSLFLRKPEAVSERIGQRVEKAITDLGYVPNYVAGGLAAAGSRVVSVIVPSLRNAFFSDTVTELEKLLAASRLQTLVGHTEYSLQQEEELVRAALSWAPAAVVLTGTSHTAATRDLLRKTRTPVVEMWELTDDPIDQAVGFSHEDVGRAVARHFLEQGYRDVAFFGARMGEDTRAADRAHGFKAEMSANSVNVRMVEDNAPASTASGARMLAGLDEPVRAIACSNDTVALGVLFEAQRRGISVPSELAVAGFGDLDFAQQCVPPLTTVRPSALDIAARVAACIRARDPHSTPEDSTPAPQVHDTGFTFVPRESS